MDQWPEVIGYLLGGSGLAALGAVGKWVLDLWKSKSEIQRLLVDERQIYIAAIRDLTTDLRSQIEQQQARITELERLIDERDKLVASLRRRVEHLEQENRRLKNEPSQIAD